MPHINLPKDYPGIRGLFAFRPETAAPLCQLAQVLLHDLHPALSAGERELIAAYVSNLNTCRFCTNSHSAIAKNQLGSGLALVKQVLADPQTAPVSNKLKALLKIAARVQSGGKNVTTGDIEEARREGLLLRPFACITGMLTDWTPGSPTTKHYMIKWVRSVYVRGITRLPLMLRL